MSSKKISVMFMALVLVVTGLFASTVSAETSVSRESEKELVDLEKALKAIDPNIELLDVSDLPEGVSLVEIDSMDEFLNNVEEVVHLNKLANSESAKLGSGPLLKDIPGMQPTALTWEHATFTKKVWYDAVFQFRRIQYEYQENWDMILGVRNIVADYIGFQFGTYHQNRAEFYVDDYDLQTIHFSIYGDYVGGVVWNDIPVGIKIPQNWFYSHNPL